MSVCSILTVRLLWARGMANVFATEHYQRHNRARLDHLESLELDLDNKSVLELGAGVGDLTRFFLRRGCRVTALDGRQDNVDLLQARHPDVQSGVSDLEAPDPHDFVFQQRYDLMFCYGLIYHLADPRPLLDVACPVVELCLLETCVSIGQRDELNSCLEDAKIDSQSLTGKGCRPTRYWIYHQLQRHFPYVYTCSTQPRHEEFPLNWRVYEQPAGLIRAVFVASRTELHNEHLFAGLVHEHTGG